MFSYNVRVVYIITFFYYGINIRPKPPTEIEGASENRSRRSGCKDAGVSRTIQELFIDMFL